MEGMAALIATRKAAWADALELQPSPSQPTTGPSQLKLKVLAAGLAFPDVPAPNTCLVACLVGRIWGFGACLHLGFWAVSVLSC